MISDRNNLSVMVNTQENDFVCQTCGKIDETLRLLSDLKKNNVITSWVRL